MELLARPRRLRVVAVVAAVVVVVVFVVATVLLRSRTSGGGRLERGDQVALILLGLLFAGALLLFTRPRVCLDGDIVVIRNVVGSYRIPLTAILAVHFADDAPWATLELADDEVISMMAIQATDKEHAVAAVTTLRQRLAQSRGGLRETGSDRVHGGTTDGP